MKVHLRKKKLKNGKTSLYLEFYKGHQSTSTGKSKIIREFEYLNLYLICNPITPQEKKQNDENLELAEKILSIRRAEVYQGKYKVKDSSKGRITVLDYFMKLIEERYETKANYDNWDAAYKHLEKYCSKSFQLQDVDIDFVKGFKKYLDKHARTKSNTGLSQNSKYSYFNKLRAALREAYNESYIDQNVVKSVRGFDQAESQREYLIHSEVQALCKADCKYPILKNAFLFSCLTGLRWSDINKMTWAEVRDEDRGARIIFRQKKTDGLEYLYISNQARTLLGNRQLKKDRVFIGLKYSAVYNTEILRWCNRAGITKHITFHSARHTNAVLLLENGADIYTVSKRLGHREVRTTQIYAKIIDEKMKQAAELIPELNLYNQ